MPYSRTVTLFDGSSDQSSTDTSGWALVADGERISVSWATDIAGASRLTLQGTNEHGFDSALAGVGSIVNVSTLTGIVLAGLYTVDAGAKWIRAARHTSNASLSIVRLQIRSN